LIWRFVFLVDAYYFGIGEYNLIRPTYQIPPWLIMTVMTCYWNCKLYSTVEVYLYYKKQYGVPITAGKAQQ
jgi:hypothetical protein